MFLIQKKYIRIVVSVIQNVPKFLKIYHIILPQLTNFMKLRPSWEAATCAATQELPSILWN
jgi:hypothetical protein